MNDLVWQRSSFCDTATCVEVSFPTTGQPFVLVRQSDHTEGAPLKFTQAEWDDFTAGIIHGELCGRDDR